MATTKTAQELASTPALERLADLRTVEDELARRAMTAQAYDILLREWKQDRRYRGGAEHLVDEIHLWYRQGFESLAKQARSRRKVDLPSFRRLNGNLHHHHSYEDRAWFPVLKRLHPECRQELKILEKDHRKLVELEAKVEDGDFEAMVEFCDHLVDHLNREEMLSVPWLLEGTGGL
ncbi:hypothetical protein AC1031_003572 [Aphanomyces cochlioides]|nr:hypothetical protein AC1031_003572 [Aphanomyces cochlioides]